MFDFFKKKPPYPVGEDGQPLSTFEEVGVMGSISSYIKIMHKQSLDMRMGFILIDRISEAIESMSRIVAREARINLRVIDALHEFCEKTIYIQTGHFGRIPKDLDKTFSDFQKFYFDNCIPCYEHLYCTETPTMFNHFSKPYGWDRPKDAKGRPVNFMMQTFKEEVTRYAQERGEDPTIYLSQIEEWEEEDYQMKMRELEPIDNDKF